MRALFNDNKRAVEKDRYNHSIDFTTLPQLGIDERGNLDTEFIVAALHENKKCAKFTEEGMEGGLRKNPNRPVSLISLEARQSVDEAVLRGLCYKKFRADITIECQEMPETGTILGFGDLKLSILLERKRCWPECVLLQKKLPCPLLDGVRYAQVESPGTLCKSDSLKVIEETKPLDKDQSQNG